MFTDKQLPAREPETAGIDNSEILGHGVSFIGGQMVKFLAVEQGSSYLNDEEVAVYGGTRVIATPIKGVVPTVDASGKQTEIVSREFHVLRESIPKQVGKWRRLLDNIGIVR